MPQATLTNPNGAFGVGTLGSFLAGRNADGSVLSAYRGTCDDFLSAGVIAYGDLVFLVPASSATVNAAWKTTAAAFADSPNRIRGVAMNACTAAGQRVQVCMYGFCHVNVGAGTAAADNFGVPSTTAGQVAPVATATDATTIAGFSLGVFMGIKDANNLAWFFLKSN